MSAPSKILVVDDDLVDRMQVKRMLSRSGLRSQLDQAEDLATARKALAERGPFECMLLDFRLPDGTGLEFVHELAGPGGLPLPVIVFTGSAESELSEACLKAGAQDYLVKGKFDDDSLERAIRYARERWQLHRELAVKAVELEETNRELERFAYVASHDLQAPLRTIQALGKRLRDRCGDDLPETGQEYLTRMLGAAERMRDLIQDLLALSRASRAQFERERVALSALVREVLEDLDGPLVEAQASVEVDDLPAVAGDATGLRQVFSNLLSNAVKFRHPDRPPRIEVRAHPAGAQVAVAVRDDGVGFDAERAEDVFRPFKRLHSAAEFPGTGIGLAICAQIVQKLGGSIRAESQPGQGTTFTVALDRWETS